jgi:G3E family GTPase
MKPAKPIEVILISGFLGAGKTTLLNHLLQDMQPAKIIVVENEFGEVPLDGSLLNKSYTKLYEFSSGCVCCTVSEELEQVLSDIIIQKAAADYLIIETTGVADPGNVGAIFLQAEIQDYFTLAAAICVVDVETVEERLHEVDEVKRQLAFATEVVINKTGRVRPDYVDEVEKMLRTVNPFAQYHRSAEGKVNAQKLLQSNVFDVPEMQAITTHVHHHHAPHTHAHGAISSVLWQTAGGVKKTELEHLLSVLLNLYQHQIYRIKGLVWFSGKPYPSLIQSAGKYLSMVEFIPEPGQTQISQLVFIGKDLKQESLERLLKPALEKEMKL